MTTELTMLAWTCVLALIQVVLAAQFFTVTNGLPYAMSARDEPARPPSLIGGRLDRAFRNLIETLPVAVAAILVAHAAGRHNGYTVWGAQLYFWGRLAYVPVYAAGIPAVRTLVWLVSILGIVLVLLGLVWG